MGDRGRTPASELAVIGTNGIESVRRPEPPSDLTAEQQSEWRAVVNRLPADWFPRETLPLLAQYCRHVVSAGRIAQMIQHMDEGLAAMTVNATHPASDEGDDNAEFSLDAYDKLLKMQEREGRAMSSLATRMRLTQQSTFDKERKKGKAGKKPWQT
jgi:hypothetical protein